MSKECFNVTKDLSFIKNVVRAFICIGYLDSEKFKLPVSWRLLQAPA